MEIKNSGEENLKKFEELVKRLEKISEEREHPKHPHPIKNESRPPHPPVPHYEEKEKLHIDFKKDNELLISIFGDEDTSRAVIDIITNSPTEIQIVLKVVLDLYNKISIFKG